jgi:predicted oxidoreductase
MGLILLMLEAIQDKENFRMITNQLEASVNPEMEIKMIRDRSLDTLERAAPSLAVESLFSTGCIINLGNN